MACVRHPGLESHPQHELARRQMRFTGGMLSFELAGGLAAGATLVESVELCRPATSMGGPETLITHPASTTHAGLLPDELEAAGILPGTVRVSCGLEHPDDIVGRIGQLFRVYRSLLADIIESGRNKGCFRDGVNPAQDAALIMATLNGMLIQGFLHEAALDPAPLLTHLKTTFIDRLLP